MVKKKSVKLEEVKKKSFYEKNFKKLLILPILLFVFSLVMIGLTIEKEGTPIYRDVSLKGGLSAIIEVQSSMTDNQLKSNLEERFGQNSFSVSELYDGGDKIGFIIDTDLEESDLISALSNIFNVEVSTSDNYSSNFISPTLSNAFFKQAMYILAISFVLMSIVIFLYFKEFVPSGAVVLSAIFDIIVTVGILDLMGFKISVAGIGALMMLIGYSIDTDVLLTNRLIREYGQDYFEKTFFAFKTGVLMSATTLIAGVAALFITNSAIIFEIAMILVVGLLVDFVSTWLQNAGILLWWLEVKNK